MRKLTWYFVVAVATAFVCLLLTAPASSTELSPRVAAALSMTFSVSAPVPPAGCTCGCVQTGNCTCPNCDVGNKGAYPHCICGCVETGKCTCPNCNHPQCTPLAKENIVAPVVGKRYKHPENGKWYTYQVDGYWHADPPVVQYVPPSVYQPVQVFGSFGGNCGPSG